MLTSATSGENSLITGAYIVQTGYSFPNARKTAEGATAQRNGAIPCEAHYSDAPFTLPVIVRGASAAEVNAAVDVLTASLRENGLTLSENGAETLTASIRDVDVDSRDNRGLWATVVYAGTRRPGWRGVYSEHPFTITGGIGTAAISDIPGDLAAKTALDLVSGAATNLIGVGFWPEPAALYDPLDAASGSATTLTNANTVYAIGGTPPDIDVNANRGSHFVLAKVATNATAAVNTSLYVATANAGVSKPAVNAPSFPWVPAVAAGNVLLGKVTIPTADVPGGSLPSSYGAAASVNSYTAGTTLDTATVTARTRTITAGASGSPTKVRIKVKCATGIYLPVTVKDAAGITVCAGYTLTASATDGWVDVFMSTKNRDVVSGETLTLYLAENTNNATQLYGSNNSSSADTRDYDLWVSPVINFDSTNTVSAKCTEAGKTATLYSVTRIPSDYGALVVPATFAATDGFTYDGGSVYPFDGANVTGSALVATFSEAEFAAPFGDSVLVVHAGGGADATGTLRVTAMHLALS